MGLRFDSWGQVGSLCALLVLLALVRLFSVWPSRAEKLVDSRPRKESRMERLKQICVVFVKCIAETIWTCGAGVLVGAHWFS